MASHPDRPLSPHLQIWRWTWAMRISILHRVTGNGLFFAGVPLLLWWLAALAGGTDSYDTFHGWVWADWSALEWSGLGIIASLVKIALKLLLIGLSWSFFSHAASGIRHFVLDIGAGFELKTNNLWAMLTPIIGLALTALFWAAILLR